MDPEIKQLLADRASLHKLPKSADRTTQLQSIEARMAAIGYKSPAAKLTKKPRPMPDDFHQYADKEPIDALMVRYRAGNPMISRWRAELGMGSPGQSIRKFRPAPDGFAAMARGKSIRALEAIYAARDSTVKRWLKEVGIVPATQAHRLAATRDFKTSFEPTIDDSMAGRAQRHLQKHGPVYKAATVNPKLDGYFVFGRRMSVDEMLGKARDMGWRVAL